jgi:hypothetical protein
MVFDIAASGFGARRAGDIRYSGGSGTDPQE